jgi:hypothetical protein
MNYPLSGYVTDDTQFSAGSVADVSTISSTTLTNSNDFAVVSNSFLYATGGIASPTSYWGGYTNATGLAAGVIVDATPLTSATNTVLEDNPFLALAFIFPRETPLALGALDAGEPLTASDPETSTAGFSVQVALNASDAKQDLVLGFFGGGISNLSGPVSLQIDESLNGSTVYDHTLTNPLLIGALFHGVPLVLGRLPGTGSLDLSVTLTVAGTTPGTQVHTNFIVGV